MSKRKKWSYHKIKTIPGEFIEGSILAEAGNLCQPWPSSFSLVLPKPTYCGNYEHIDYYISSKPYRPQPCFHIRNTVDRFPLPSISFETIATMRCSDGSYKKEGREVDTHDNYFGYAFGDGYRLPFLPDLNQAHREALEFFASGCQPIVANWAVNLFEIKEIIEMAAAAFKALKLFRELAKERIPYSWGMFTRKLQRLNSVDRVTAITRILSKEAANAFLAYSFAIAPLLADVKKTADELSSLSARVAFFRKNNKKPVKVNFSKDLSNALSLDLPSFPPVPDSSVGYYGTNIFNTQYKAKYCASALATYDVSGLKDNDIAYRLAKQAFGFADPLVFLWEIIPFSFIVDWFYKVGDYLASLPSISTFPYVLTDVCHSLSVQQTKTYLHYHYVGKIYTERIMQQQVVFIENINYYKRDLGIPIALTGLDASLPGFQQLMLALALGRQLFR